MIIEAGYTITLDCPQPTPAVLLLSVHPAQRDALLTQDRLVAQPDQGRARLFPRAFRDGFGNIATRLVMPGGRTTLSTRFWIENDGQPDVLPVGQPPQPIDQLPDDVLQFLLPSRYCDTEALMEMAWAMFGHLGEGWPRVEAILGAVHARIQFGYAHARATRTAREAWDEGRGVCRDFAHLGVALCRCMNVPARYVNGYLGDIGIPPVDAPMDFSAWFQVWLGGRWWNLDARHHAPRIGRVLIAVGRDAADVAMITQYGAGGLAHFEVVTHEVTAAARRFATA